MPQLMPTPSMYVRRAKARFRGRGLRTPSFTYKDAEMRRLGVLGHEFGMRHPVWSINNKDDARAWAEHLGLPQPRLVGHYDHITAVPWDELPDEVVLKPTKGAGSRGVFLLHRQGEAWQVLGQGRTASSEQVEQEFRSLVEEGAVSAGVVLEQLIVDPRRPGLPPVDWKAYTFFGRVGLVLAKALQVDSKGNTQVGWRIFDENWSDLGEIGPGRPVDRTIQPPVHGEELLALARKASAAVPRAFLRVDLYDGRDGAVFGEITPEPGGARRRLTSHIDRMLGECWEEAEARLQIRAVRAGVLDPADRVLPEAELRREKVSND